MAQLKDTTIQGSARVTDTLYSNAVQAKIFNIPTASNGTTYGPGTDGQVLKSNGASVYWASDSNSDINVKQLAAITTSGAYPIILANSTATTEVTGTVNKSANLTYNPSTKALSTGGTINGLTFTAASTGFTIAGGTTSKTLTVSNTYTLGAACAKGVTDNSSNADVTSSDTNLITGRTLYYQLAKKGYTTNTGTVTSVTLTQGAGITVSDSGTAITASGSRTISITGMNTTSGSTSKCLTEKGTWASFSNNAGTVTSVQVQASSPLQSSTSTAQSATLSTTISFTNQDPNKVLAGPSSGSSAGAPSFRALVAADIPSLDWSKIGSGKPTTLSGYGITDAAASDHTQAVNKGGTNITSYTIGDILYASASTTLSKLAGNTTTTVKYLKSVATTSGTAVAPAWAQIAASEISGLGAAATKAVTDNSSNADVTSTDTNLITGRTLYYQLAKKGYTTNTGTVTSVTLTSGSGITVSDSGTAITGSGSRTISITGVDTSSGSTAKCLTEKGTWASFTNNAGTVTSVQVQASGPLSSSTSTAQSSTLSTTISFSNQDPNKVLAGPSSGSSAAAPTFRALVAADIPNLSWNKITSDKPTTLSGYGITDGVSSSALNDYVLKAGDTMTGTLNLKTSTIDITTAPSSALNEDYLYFKDKDGDSVGMLRVNQTTENIVSLQLSARRVVNTNTIFNGLELKIGSDGTRTVSIGAPDAWRTALGLGSMATANTGDYLPLSGGDMTGTIKLAATAGLRTNNDAGWTMNQYGNITHLRSNTSDTVGIAAYDGSIKFKVAFDSGNTDVTGYLAAAGGVYATNGALVTRAAQPMLYFQNASAQDIGQIFVSQNHLYFRTRPSAGSSNYTDYIFSGATSGGNYSRYIYSTANFSLSGTTLTITPPGW